MSTRAQIPMKPAAAPARGPTPARSITLVPSGVLQRKCACSGLESSARCEECRKKDTRSVTENADDNKRVASVPIADRKIPPFVDPHLGHDFGNIRVHAAEQTARPMGGDASAPAQQQNATPPATAGNANAAAAPTLAYSTIGSPTSEPCGGYKWKVVWKLNGAGSSTNGFIVQKVNFRYSDGACGGSGGGVGDMEQTYWEAWQVQAGQIVNLAGGSGTDNFEGPSATGRFGSHYEEGFAKFMTNYSDPLKWGRVPSAGTALLATYDQPAGWSDAGAVHRSIKSEFNCCQGASDTNIKTVP